MREGNAAAVRHHAAAQIQTRLTMAFAVGVAGIQITVLAEITQAGAVGAMAGVIIGAGDGPAQATIIEQRAVYPSLPGRARRFTVGEVNAVLIRRFSCRVKGMETRSVMLLSSWVKWLRVF